MFPSLVSAIPTLPQSPGSAPFVDTPVDEIAYSLAFTF